MDEEGDAERAAQWDLAAADAAYKAQVEAALAHQRAVEEEHCLLLEQLEVLNHPSTQPGDVCACVLGVGGGGGGLAVLFEQAHMQMFDSANCRPRQITSSYRSDQNP